MQYKVRICTDSFVKETDFFSKEKATKIKKDMLLKGFKIVILVPEF